MTATLRLTRLDAVDAPVSERVRTVMGTSLRIGRGSDNDWVVDDQRRLVSRHHCLIRFHDGVYAVVDTSANGVFLNGSPRAIGRDNSRILSDGDTLRLADITIAVALVEGGAKDDAFRSVLPPRSTGLHECEARTAPFPSGPLDDPLLPSARVSRASVADDPTFPSASFEDGPLRRGPSALPFSAASAGYKASALSGRPLSWGREAAARWADVDDSPAMTSASLSLEGRNAPEHEAFQTSLPGQLFIPEDWDRDNEADRALGHSLDGFRGPVEDAEVSSDAPAPATGVTAPSPMPSTPDDPVLVALVQALGRVEAAILLPGEGGDAAVMPVLQAPLEMTLAWLRAMAPGQAGQVLGGLADDLAARLAAERRSVFTSRQEQREAEAAPPPRSGNDSA